MTRPGLPSWLLSALILGLFLTVSAPTKGQSPQSPHHARPALAQAINEATAPVLSHAQGAVVVSAPLDSDSPAPRSAHLVERIVSLVAGAIGPTTTHVPTPMSLAEARTHGANSLAYVQPRLANGEINITLDIYPVARNIWDRARTSEPGPVAHGFGSSRIDAEIRSFLAPIPLVAQATRKVPLPSPEVVAMNCEDLDQDGALEILIVSRHMIATGRIHHNRFSIHQKADWKDVSPIAPSPWREPLGTLVSSDSVYVGLTDRARSLRLSPRLDLLDTFDGMPIATPGGVACARRRLGSMASDLLPCLSSSEKLPRQAFPSPVFAFDASAAAQIVDKEGRVRNAFAARNPSDASVLLTDDRGNQHLLRNVGAQLALADVDLDGDPDLLASKNVLVPRSDALILRSWRKSGILEKRMELAVPDGIHALAVCPPDGPGQRKVLVATSKELWILG